MRDATVTFRLPDDIRKALEEYAKANDLSFSQVCRRALKEFTEKVAGGK